MQTAREYESALERNPADTEAFVALRKTYRQAKEHDKLITLYETRAQAIEDGNKAAELFYLAAELRLDQLSDTAGAEADLANAVHRDPGHIRAAARLKDLYREQGRTSQYMEMLELEAAAVARTRDPARIAELQAEMGQLFVNHFARIERTIRNAQRPGKMSTDHVKSIESARKIYRALGDYRSVVRLYELELEGTTEPKRRADLLLGLGRVLAEKLEELDAAAQRLGEVIRLRPRDEKALELLAAVYANPNWIGADGADRSAAIYFQIARRRHEAGDTENTISALRKALTAVPGHPEASDLIERTYYDARRFQDLDRYYRERVQGATVPEEQINFLYKRAQLAEGDLDDVAEAQRIYGEIAAQEVPGGPAGERLAELYAAGHEYAKLAELREGQLGAVEDALVRVRLMTELATLYGDRLSDRDQAAVYLHAILQIEPGNQAALAAYSDHFRDKEDWPALADLLDFGLEQARAAGASPDELTRRLEEIATVAEKNLGDGERAVVAWRHIEDIDPVAPRARDMQKRILLKSKSFDRIVPILERESELTEDPAQKIEILRRIAQIQREKLGAPARALEIYQEILHLAPQDQVALRALVEIYEKQGDYAGLARTLRNQIEAAGSKQEKVSLLRRLLVIYDERLNDVDAGAWAASEILKLVPGDRDTLSRLEDLLAGAGDHAGLVQTLDYHAQHASTPDEHIEVLVRAAELLGTALGDTPGAAARWEEVVRLDPDDGRALDALTEIYSRLEQHLDLARILDAQVDRLVGDPRQQADYLRRLADLAEVQLGDRRRAQRAWEALLELLPSDATTMDALARIYSSGEEWATLVKILDRQIPHVGDPARAAELALRRAEILDTKLNNPREAARALEQLVSELDPRNWPAHERLRALYERDNDWPRVVKIAERQLFLTEAPDDRAQRALELGVLWRDKLRDDAKATNAFERTLEIDARNLEAMQALAPLYAAAKDWDNVIRLNERLLDQTEEPDSRHRLILEIASILEQQLEDARGAFEWYRRAYDERPDAESLSLIDSIADKHALHEELIQVYETARTRAVEPIEQLAAALKVAEICEKKLNDPGRAFASLRDALVADPAGLELLPLLETLAERTGDWAGLLEVYARVARARPEMGDKVGLLRLRSEVKEKRLGDPSGALDELVRSFALAPNNAATQDEILRLAGVTGRWEDALKVQAQLFALAEDLPRKLAVAQQAAVLVETEVKDLVRAFRAYLNAFRLAPEDAEIVAHLWRLATRIDRYEGAPSLSPRAERALGAMDDGDIEAQITPTPEGATEAAVSPVSDTLTHDVTGEAAAAGGDAAEGEARDDDQDEYGEPDLVREASLARPPATLRFADPDEQTPPDANEPIAVAPADYDEVDVPISVGEGDDEDTRRADAAADMDMADDDAEDEEDATVDVDDAAVIAVAVDTESSGVLEELEVDDMEVSDDGERTPEPPPFSRMSPHAPPPPVPGRRVPFAAPFETPWEELAQAYDALPAPETATRKRYLLKQAEVWERGQKDMGRALGALERAFRLDPEDKEVRRELERIAAEKDRWDQICDIYLAAIDEFAPAEHAVSIHHEVARFREALGQVDKAEERYRAIQALKPDDVKALDRLEQISREQARWSDLAQILERRTEGSAVPMPPGTARRAKLAELAGLYEQWLEKPYEAIDTLERLASEAADEAAEQTPSGPIVPVGGADVSAAVDAAIDAAIVDGDSGPAVEAADAERAAGRAEGDVPGAVITTPTAPASPVLDGVTRDQTIAACEGLARLYGRVGLWAKVVDALQRQVELTQDPAAARVLRLRIADVYERELGQGERAIDAFEAMRAADPDDEQALGALDRLYEAHGRWDDLQATLDRHAKLATGDARVKLVRRRAQILEERLANPDAAAAALRELGSTGFLDNDLAIALVRNLRRAGLAHEAARTLGTQIETARKADLPAASVVALLLELSAVRADDLDDEPGAREAVAEALRIAPEDPTALGALARIALKSNDFTAYAATRRREARAQPDTALAVESLLDAGRVYRDQANDMAEARSCFEEALTRDPTSIDTLRALAALHASQGEWTDARDRLLRELELVDGAEARAAVLTDLARCLWEGFSDSVQAQKHLDEALELAPEYLQAVLTAADIYYKDGQWALAEKRLTEAVRRVRNNPEQSARLYVRLAEVSDRLGRVDEAHRQLTEADRLAPGQLATRLALGENRFRAGKWREVTVILGNLGDHPDAARQAPEVADGLAHAAQAEMKLRRPERALALYESALALSANHGPSLRALADVALERGEKGTARTYLERLVEATGDREARSSLLEQLGDLYLDAGESAQAREAYESAVRLFDHPTEAQIPVLEKVLGLQRDANDVEAASHTSNQLIGLVQDPKERALRRREAATLIAARGDGEEALELLEAAWADNPQDEAVLGSLCDILARQGKLKQVAKRLSQVLPELPPPADTTAALQLRASLWERLGESKRKKDKPGAILAFEQVVALDPDRVGARIALADLYGPQVEFADAAIANLRRLVATDPTRVDSLRAFADVCATRGLVDPARCAYELVDVLSGDDDTARAFLKKHPVPELKADDAYAATLNDEDRRLLGGAEAGVMAEVFTLLWEGAPHLLNERLEDLDVTAEDKVSPMSDSETARAYGQIAKALGNKKTGLYLKRGSEMAQMEIIVQTPPALIFGTELLAMPLAGARFEIARGLELTRPEYILAAGVRPRQFTELFGNVLRAFHPRHAKRRAPAQDATGEQATNLRKNVPYKVSKRLIDLFQEMGSTSWSSVRWRKVVSDAGNQTGLLLCGDLRAAVRGVLRTGKLNVDASPDELIRLAAEHDPLRQLLRFAVSEHFFQLREKLGTAAVRAAAA
ncbi:MAG: tetratricopeptide repeat protein [Pseudomonadota bacterium]